MRYALILLLWAVTANASNFSLNDYLGRVRKEHKGFISAVKTAKGTEGRSVEPEVSLVPAFFIATNWSRDGRPTNAPTFQGTQTNFDSYQLGVSKLTTFGLKAQVSYNIGYTNIVGATLLPISQFYDAKPLLEFTQNLWRNGWGKETRATVEMQSAQVLSTTFTESYKAREILSNAETAYWSLSLARSVVEVQEQTLDRAKKILDWARRRVNNDLADKADLLQAEAAHEQRVLDLQTARDDEETASRRFNTMLGIDTDDVDTTLDKLDSNRVQGLELPKRAALRDDVKAAQQQERMAVANTELVRQRLSPTLDLTGNVALNARNTNLTTGMGDSFSTRYPLVQIGVKFNMPLDFGLVSDAKDAALVERQGAELAYLRKFYDQEREWKDLTRKFTQAKKRLDLATKIEDIQREKITHEKGRLDRGRTTTYQVILMEQDYALARLARLRSANEVLSIHSKLKTFGGDL